MNTVSSGVGVFHNILQPSQRETSKKVVIVYVHEIFWKPGEERVTHSAV